MSDEQTQSQEETVQESPVAETPPVEETPAVAVKETPSKLVGMDQLKAGQTVRLHERIKDVSPKGEVRERIQIFEGMVLALGGKGISRTMTIRKVSDGIGVEKIYPINSPVVAKIELVKTAKVRQAKLGFLKNLKMGFKRKLKETYTELGMEKKKK
jgi:large subunit ribosomal protein L19